MSDPSSDAMYKECLWVPRPKHCADTVDTIELATLSRVACAGGDGSPERTEAGWHERFASDPGNSQASLVCSLKLPKLSPAVRAAHRDATAGFFQGSYALSLTRSSALVTQHQTQLPDVAPAVDAAHSRTKQGGRK